jgi:small conductance mechanosensitive channel
MTDAQMLLWPFLRWILAPLTILGIGYGIYRLLRAGIRGIFLAAADRVPGAEGDPGRERTVQRLETLRKLSVEVLRLALIVLFGLTFLRSLGLDLAPLLAGVGVVGLGVTLAAQSLLKDYLNGILILVENQYNVGDTVEINGLTGTVERLWLRLTTLRLIDGRLAFIPNGQILTVVNQTKDWSAARVEIGVPSDADVSRAVELIDACVRALAEERAEEVLEPPRSWGIVAVRERDVLLRGLVKTLPGRQWELERLLRLRIQESFAREGIPFASPRSEVRIVDSLAPRGTDQGGGPGKVSA